MDDFMNVPDSYNPLETMEKLLPILARSLGFSEADILRLTAHELTPALLQRSPLERMQMMCDRLESAFSVQQGNF
jgi:hypothetical protein